MRCIRVLTLICFTLQAAKCCLLSLGAEFDEDEAFEELQTLPTVGIKDEAVKEVAKQLQVGSCSYKR